MKKTSEEFMEWLGLKVGDKIKVKIDECNITNKPIYENFEITHHNCLDIPVLTNTNGQKWLEFLLDRDVNILPQPKRVGDLKCEKFKKCENCPLKSICLMNVLRTLYEQLEVWKNSEYFDQEIYDILKARLDKEIKNND